MMAAPLEISAFS